MKSIRIVAWVAVGAMLLAIGYGSAAGGFGDDFSSLWALPWGRVSLIDLYAGLLIFGAWIAYREKSLGRTVLWSIALLTLGNLTAGVYLVWAAHNSGDVAGLLLGNSNTTDR
jgi:hypothetical protein